MSRDEYFFLFGTVYLHWGVVLNSPGVKCDNVIKGLWCEPCNPREHEREARESGTDPMDSAEDALYNFISRKEGEERILVPDKAALLAPTDDATPGLVTVAFASAIVKDTLPRTGLLFAHKTQRTHPSCENRESRTALC